MDPLRGMLLAGSENAWLREHAMRWSFVRRAVSRFMPGEGVDEALAAATTLGRQGMGTILTHLGENIADLSEADAEATHYFDLVGRIEGARLDSEVSVKLTQLGLDQDPARPRAHVERLASRAMAARQRLWIDMESSPYTARTLDFYRAVRPAHPNVGVALQAYLRSSAAEVDSLLALGSAVRLVKGAYKEPPTLAFPDKRDVDENFFAMAQRFLSPEARRAGVWLTVGTHDARLVDRIIAWAAANGVAKDAFEFAMLYGIGREQQARLVREGFRLRVLISYGSHWFPWYMRRLAERPANVLFVLRNMLGG